jgi:hypothetical protein
VKLFPNGDRLADRGHQALIGRFLAITSDAWRVAREVPLPLPGDKRSWDLLLRSPVRPGSSTQLVGVEAETRIRDVQWLVRRIRELERDGDRHTTIVAVTADALIGDRERCLQAGMDDYLAKPFKRQELEATLQRYLSPAKVESVVGAEIAPVNPE